MANYRNHDRQQIELKTMCINDFVPKDHLSRVIVSIIDYLDLKGFDEYFKNDLYGRKAYPIKSLLGILIYAFLNGLFHTRKIENACIENIVYRYLCCDDVPDHCTISRFWNRFSDQIEDILIQTVYIGETQGLINFEHISGDGVRIKGIGSRDMIYSKESAKVKLENIEQSIKKLMEEIETCNNEENKTNILDTINKKEQLKSKIERGMIELKEIQEEIKGEQYKGKKVETTNYNHLTDKGARLIKTKDGYISGYNAQALSDNKTNMIIAADISGNINDMYNGKPLLEKLKSIVDYNTFHKGVFTFDNGYFSEEFIKYGLDNILDLYIDTLPDSKAPSQSYKKKADTTPDLTYDKKKDVYICKSGLHLKFYKHYWREGRAYAEYKINCKGCGFINNCRVEKGRQRRKKTVRVESLDRKDEIEQNKNEFYEFMKERMSTEDAKKIYKIRFKNIEPVFAQIEGNRDFRRFSVYGKIKSKGQWYFNCVVHNLTKIINYSSFGQKLVAA